MYHNTLPSQDYRLPPIHTLPVELLAQIFTLSVHSSLFQIDDAEESSMADFPFDPANMLTTLAISSVSQYGRFPVCKYADHTCHFLC